jgi:hypothetical protein
MPDQRTSAGSGSRSVRMAQAASYHGSQCMSKGGSQPMLRACEAVHHAHPMGSWLLCDEELPSASRRVLRLGKHRASTQAKKAPGSRTPHSAHARLALCEYSDYP